ncbi:MAG TPA: hypothetical protein VN178_03950 [Rubrobacter sp.]|nr:hypothetical protein [Rubrobacter sp.]
MEYARLGNTGLMVSELCLRCMTFGQEADEKTSKEIVATDFGLRAVMGYLPERS